MNPKDALRCLVMWSLALARYTTKGIGSQQTHHYLDSLGLGSDISSAHTKAALGFQFLSGPKAKGSFQQRHAISSTHRIMQLVYIIPRESMKLFSLSLLEYKLESWPKAPVNTGERGVNKPSLADITHTAKETFGEESLQYVLKAHSRRRGRKAVQSPREAVLGNINI